MPEFMLCPVCGSGSAIKDWHTPFNGENTIKDWDASYERAILYGLSCGHKALILYLDEVTDEEIIKAVISFIKNK